MLKAIIKYFKLASFMSRNANDRLHQDEQSVLLMPATYQQRVEYLTKTYQSSYDIVFREFSLSSHRNNQAFLIYISGLADESLINNSILSPLMIELEKMGNANIEITSFIKNHLPTTQIRKASQAEQIHHGILSGDTALVLSASADILLINTRTWEGRSVEKPEEETTIRGSHEGFTESLAINTALVRRRIKNPNLIIEKLIIGEQTRTDVCIIYLRNIANEKIVSEVKNRLERIEIDAVLESGYLEEFIEDAPFSPFPTVANTERPDTVAAKLLEGRVAILTEGTPVALSVPHLFVETLMITEDYYSRPYYTTLIRFIRLIALIITLMLPALYVAIINYHPELLPTRMAISVAIAFEGIPLPAIIEVLLMGLLFEILREAGVRMPRAVGQAVSIVGALILGEAAISAGLVGAPIVIVTALTAIAGFILTANLDAVTLLRIPYIFAAGFVGLPGIMAFSIVVIIHMASLRSFGVPYLSPIAPFASEDWKDILIRVPWWAMRNRPRMLFPKDRTRVPEGQKPGPQRE